MNKEFYVIVDAEDKEVNFYDRTFPNSYNRAILSARQVDDSVVLHRTIGPDGEKHDKIIWPEKYRKVLTLSTTLSESML